MMQPCLFCGGDPSEPDHLKRCDGRQGRVEAALPDRATVRALRDDAMTRVESKAERVHPAFADEARAFVLRYLREHGPTDAERLSIACKRAGIVPHDDRAFGPVYFNLARKGLIAKVGSARRTRGHGTAGGNVWAVAV